MLGVESVGKGLWLARNQEERPVLLLLLLLLFLLLVDSGLGLGSRRPPTFATRNRTAQATT
jgi:hypothetical protein